MVATTTGILGSSISIQSAQQGRIVHVHIHNTKNNGEVSDIGVDTLFTGVVIGTVVAGLASLTSKNAPYCACSRNICRNQVSPQVDTRLHLVFVTRKGALLGGLRGREIGHVCSFTESFQYNQSRVE